MDIKVGKYRLRSDEKCLWIDEEYPTKDKKGNLTGKTQTRKVAGYTNSIDNLIRQFCAHKHRASEAETVEQLIKEMKQMLDDASLLKKTAVTNDLKAMRKTGKQIKEINR